MKPTTKNGPGKAQNLFHYLCAQGFQSLVPLITLPIYTRFIPPAEYGVTDMFQLVMIIGLGLGNWGLQNAFDRFYFAHQDSREKQIRLLSTLIGFTFVCLIPVFVATIFFRSHLSQVLAHTPKWSGLLLFVVLNGYFDYLNNFFFAFLRNGEKAAEYMRFNLLRVGATTALGLFLVVGLKKGILGLVIAQVSIQIGLFLLLSFSIGIRNLFVFDKTLLRDSFRFGWPLMSKVFLGVLNVSIDKYMVGTILSLAALGIYSRAQLISYGAVFTIMTAIQNVYGPQWNRILFSKHTENKNGLSLLFTEFVCVSLVPVMALFLSCREVFSVLLPAEYHGALPLIIILGYHYALQTFGKLLGAIGAYLEMTKFTALTMLVSYPINIGLNFLLIPRYGVLGSVLATLSVGVLTIVISALVYGKRYRVGYEAKKLVLLYGILLGCAVCSLGGLYRIFPHSVDVLLRIGFGCLFVIVWAKIYGVDKLTALKAKLRIRRTAFSVP